MSSFVDRLLMNRCMERSHDSRKPRTNTACRITDATRWDRTWSSCLVFILVLVLCVQVYIPACAAYMLASYIFSSHFPRLLGSSCSLCLFSFGTLLLYCASRVFEALGLC
jgi:hypothetical protein